MKSSFSRSVRVAAALVLALTVAGAAHGAGKEPPNDIVLTDSGRLAGVRSHDGKVISYKGIPFAAAPVGTLRWTPPEPPAPWEGVRIADKFGAFHSGELPYFFLNLKVLNRPWQPVDHTLAKQCAEYLKSFAATGDPNTKGLPPWPATNADSPKVMELGEKVSPMPLADPARAAFWKEFLERGE